LVVHADSGVKRGMAERAIKGKSEITFWYVCVEKKE
jgi:hypothetical protein